MTQPIATDVITEAEAHAIRSAYARGQGKLAQDVTLADALPSQLTRADLQAMRPDEITQAQRDGRLALLMVAPHAFGSAAGDRRAPLAAGSAEALSVDPNQLTRADLQGMTPAEIIAAADAGRLSFVSGGTLSNTHKTGLHKGAERDLTTGPTGPRLAPGPGEHGATHTPLPTRQ